MRISEQRIEPWKFWALTTFMVLMYCNFFPFPSDVEAYSAYSGDVRTPLTSFLAQVKNFSFLISFFALVRLITVNDKNFINKQNFSVYILLSSFIALLIFYYIFFRKYDGYANIFYLQVFTIISSVVLVYAINKLSDIENVVYWSLVFSLALSLLGVAILPERAKHMQSFMSAGVMLNEEIGGLWKGLFVHKNVAGGYFMILLCMSVVRLRYRVRVGLSLVVGLFSVVFIYFSGSNTAIISPVLVIFLTSSLTGPQLWRRILVEIFCAFYILFPFIFLNIYNNLHFSLDNREKLWEVAVAYSNASILFGSGYMNGFSGEDIKPWLTEAWMRDVGHGHSGVIDVLLQFGLVGLTLIYLAIRTTMLRYITHLNKLGRYDPSRPYVLGLFSVFLCCVIRSMVEPDILTNRGGWFIMLIAIASSALLKNREASDDLQLASGQSSY